MGCLRTAFCLPPNGSQSFAKGYRLLWFLRDYSLAAILLRALTLAFDSLLIGGIFFQAILLPRPLAADANVFCRRARNLLLSAGIGLILTQICFASLDCAMLIGPGSLRVADMYTANYFLAAILFVATSAAFLCVLHLAPLPKPIWLAFIVPLLFAIVWTSHSASRLEHRIPLMMLTALHQLAVAIWIGGLPFLWLLLGSGKPESSVAVIRAVKKYSNAAWVSVIVLVAAGVALGWFYTQSWSALYGTAYGVVLLAKSIMLASLLLVAVSNFLFIRNGHLKMPPSLLRVARLSEVEIGIGFTIILAAASLTAQPPAVDLVQNRLTLPEIAARISPQWPRLKTPPISAMPAVPSIGQLMRRYAISPDDAASANNRVERAWSECNHHWAGIAVLAAGIFALLGRWRRAPWARHWPLIFFALAIFLFFRADPEAWPLGPRGFWTSFYNPEELEHRLSILLILSFAAFEWSVQTQLLVSGRAALVFPAACALGGALLFTHDHSLGNIKAELMIEISHTAIAICAVFAGWSRWLELRGTAGRTRSAAAWIWPVSLILIGLILLNYREA
jgi:putative copper resistance protein D